MNLPLKYNLSRVGVILSNWSIALLIYAPIAFLGSLITAVIPGILILLWFAAIVFTLGTALLLPDFTTFPSQIGDFLNNSSGFLDFALISAPYALVIGLILSVVSSILLALEPSTKKHHGRIAITIIIAVILAIVCVYIIITAANKGGA